MLRTLTLTGSLVCLLAMAASAEGQALPTATAAAQIQAGLGGTYAKTDYGDKPIKGVTGFADLDFPSKHFGIEADIHYVALATPIDIAENSYLIGPRFLIRKGRFTPYAKLLGGVGSFVVQESADNPNATTASYLAYAFGGGLDIDVTHHIVVRAIDFESQRWPNFGRDGLTPTVITVGVAYRFR